MRELIDKHSIHHPKKSTVPNTINLTTLDSIIYRTKLSYSTDRFLLSQPHSVIFLALALATVIFTILNWQLLKPRQVEELWYLSVILLLQIYTSGAAAVVVFNKIRIKSRMAIIDIVDYYLVSTFKNRMLGDVVFTGNRK